MSALIAPSILSADFSKLREEVEMLNHSKADWIHVDVMDGMFVPNITFGMPVCKAIHQHAEKPLDVHLMIEKPERFIRLFKEAGAQMISVHYEACTHLHRAIEQIKQEGCKAGVALNPHTSVDLLEDVLGILDVVCLMSVNPGFGGQKFIPHSLQKINKLRQMIDRQGTQVLIEVDGGVDNENAASIISEGADILVSGSHIFKSENPLQTISVLKDLTKPRPVSI